MQLAGYQIQLYLNKFWSAYMAVLQWFVWLLLAQWVSKFNPKIFEGLSMCINWLLSFWAHQNVLCYSWTQMVWNQLNSLEVDLYDPGRKLTDAGKRFQFSDAQLARSCFPYSSTHNKSYLLPDQYLHLM